MNFIEKNGKEPMPSFGIIDSQSVKTVSYSDCRGFDGGRKIKGRKRHIVVDTLGHLIQVVVHAANTHDTKAAHFVLHAAVEKSPRISIFSGNAGYRGTAVDFVEQVPDLKMHISKAHSGYLCSFAHSLDCGANLCLAGKLQTTVQGL
ncbi:transposase [Nitrosomonas sp. Nm166]|uniref:transposase n=1 Tax=Nitrosomonas sp. Nm166 TaxID=1881054 RepID=UPI001C42F5E4|nr:transposase [Nitrosomonas sp. Nm166]